MDGRNPKHRKMSRRILEGVTKNVLAVSRFGDLPYFRFECRGALRQPQFCADRIGINREVGR